MKNLGSALPVGNEGSSYTLQLQEETFLVLESGSTFREFRWLVSLGFQTGDCLVGVGFSFNGTSVGRICFFLVVHVIQEFLKRMRNVSYGINSLINRSHSLRVFFFSDFFF